MLKGQKGITLVALVVTIIVLIILAGVSIALVLGQAANAETDFFSNITDYIDSQS